MDWKSFVKDLGLVEGLVAGAVIGLAGGVAICAAMYPVFQSQEWAAWVQAIGSVAAIFMSAWIGNRQAKTAMEIHVRDVELRNSQLADELGRQADAVAAKALQDFENSLAETAVHQIAIQRLHLDIINLCSDVNILLPRLAGYKAKCDEIGVKLDAMSLHSATHRRYLMQDRREYAERASETIEQLNEVGREADDIGNSLAALPRGSFRICSPSLANEVAYAINNLHSAALEIEHSRAGKEILASLSSAEKNLRGALDELKRLLERPSPTNGHVTESLA